MVNFENLIREVVREEVKTAVADTLSDIKEEISNSLTNSLRRANTLISTSNGHCTDGGDRHVGHCY